MRSIFVNMKQGVTGSGSPADSSYPETAAANAELESKLTGGGQHGSGGGGSATPNEAQASLCCLHVHAGYQQPTSLHAPC